MTDFIMICSREHRNILLKMSVKYIMRLSFETNPFLEIFIVAIIMTAVSVYRELYQNARPFTLPKSAAKYGGAVAFRFLHYIYILISVGFFAFFRGKWLTDLFMGLELFMLLSIVAGWYIFECCWNSYLEVMFYDVHPHTYSATINPTFKCLFTPIDGAVKSVFGLMYVVNVAIIFMRMRLTPVFKALYGMAFMYFFVRYGVLDTIYTTAQRNYPKNNFALGTIQKLYDRYVR